MKARRIAELGLLSAIALIMFVIELRIPNPFPIPGVKLGLANIITVYAVFRYRAYETAMIVLVRLLLGSMFSGNPSALLYSVSGAVCCLGGMLLLSRILPEKEIWLCSVIGAMLHNFGQIGAAIAVMRSYSVIAYLPILLVTGSLAGLFTGLTVQYLLKRMKPHQQ